MQYNFYNIEILGEENLKGVSIPVVVDSFKYLTDEQMADIAKVLNAYRTVFVRSNEGDYLETRVFSVYGEVFDCFYGEVAAIYSLTQSSYIREIESGEKYITVTEKKENMVSISYRDSEAVGVTHEVKLSEIESKVLDDNGKAKKYSITVKENPDLNTRIIYTEDAAEFSKLRKKDSLRNQISEDKIVIFYDKEFDMIYFHIIRVCFSCKKLDSRQQIAFIVSFLINQGVDREKITKICHILRNGQFALMDIKLEDDKFFVRMNARILAEGILNI